MLDRFRTLIYWACGIVLLVGVLAYIMVLNGSASSFFDDQRGTLQPTDFGSLSFTPDADGYLLCDPSACPDAEPNGPMPVFPLSPADLRLIFASISDSAPNITLRDFNPATNQLEFIERLASDPLPTVISIRLLERAQSQTAVAIYSYKPVGSSDAKDHQERVERWLLTVSNRASRRNQ
jgi:hypothetical protein